MRPHLKKPRSHVVECVFSRYVISEKHTVRTSVENASNRLVRLLASSVPNLHLKYFAIHPQSVRTKLHSNRHLVLSLELVVHHSLH